MLSGGLDDSSTDKRLFAKGQLTAVGGTCGRHFVPNRRAEWSMRLGVLTRLGIKEPWFRLF